MELDSSFSSLLRNLKVDDPSLPPKTWESIASESGAARSGDPSQDPLYDPSTVSEAILSRLVINALQGTKSALAEVEKLSAAFCSSPADRTFHRVPSLWHRSSSTSALGKILRSIWHSGLVFFFLRQFVEYFRDVNLDLIGRSGDKGNGSGNQMGTEFAENCLIPSTGEVHYKNEVGMHPPYTLVNQAFSVAVGKVLEGYLCSLSTLFASVEVRRSSKSVDALPHVAYGTGSLTGVAHSEITVLEVYLHTKELRTQIEALGNICFPKVEDLASSTLSKEDLTVDTDLDFQSFPRGADLLTYLYVQLCDADPIHHALLKFLFIRSCEPYCGFIKSWIYRASIDDPYEEFIVAYSDNSPTFNGRACFLEGFSLASVKERDCVSVPCFLKDVFCPLLRAGQQLQVLVKLLELCNCAVIRDYSCAGGTYVTCDLAKLEDILPCWGGIPSDSPSCLNPLTFSRKDLGAMIIKRETIYGMMLEKLQSFFTKLHVRYQQMNHIVFPFTTVPVVLGKRRGGINIPFTSMSDRALILSTSTNDNGAPDMAVGHKDSDASSTSDESSYEVESLQSSQSFSFSSSEEQIEPGGFSELSDVVQPAEFLFSSLSPGYANACVLKNSSEIGRPPCSPQRSFQKNCGRLGPVTGLANFHHEDAKLSQLYVHLQSGHPQCCKTSEALDEDYQSGRCWPLGGLLKNPFYVDMKSRGPKQPHFTDCSLHETDENTENMGRGELYFGETFVPDIPELEPMWRAQLMNATCGTSLSSTCIPQLQNYNHYGLITNPLLTKSACLRRLRHLRDGNSISNRRSFLSYHDFSSVADPCKVYWDLLASPDIHGSQVEAPVCVGSSASAVGVNEYTGEYVEHGLADQSVLSAACSSRKEKLLSEDFPGSASGGADWEGSLRYSGKDVTLSAGDTTYGPTAMFEIPLDVIIDKCIVQDILLQYKYVSDFTMKLLEEGFHLREHLLALRRYHFMELADWADSFISSLRNQKWYATEPEQKIAEIQGLLDLALQRSSCESDDHKEMLFVCMKGQDMMPLSTSAIGVHAFDFVALGYRVNWPISIVVTPDALKIYADIFSFLIQVRLAVFSLNDVWHSLKALMHSTNHTQHMGSHEMKHFSILIKMRQQINHFVFTLQQYVHSQLSDVSWCRFQHSLKHQVKDMLDLESVHMSYLADALHICFLSSETQSTAIIINNILQCALDFQLCFTGSGWNVGSDGLGLSDLLSQMNFSQVFTIKDAFEKNLKDLYLCYLKSPKHGEFSLCSFWGYLNYNDYYSITISKGTRYLHR